VAGFFKDLGANVKFDQFEPREFVAQGDKVIALGFYSAQVPATGRRYQSEWAMVFTLRKGKVARFREYADSAAIKAAFASAPAGV
jgi:hypothetical protein